MSLVQNPIAEQPQTKSGIESAVIIQYDKPALEKA
jgi:hypothetical protein